MRAVIQAHAFHEPDKLPQLFKRKGNQAAPVNAERATFETDEWWASG